mmetsp:Transcript_115453/g.313406  ORF Transcript_115453/g.313406 Transcript_115453/m.313406 type:complete len:582 (-) Transcript_115453:153-1898(-)
MVSASRLAWLGDKLAAGRQCRVKLNTHCDRIIANFILLPQVDGAMMNSQAILIVQSLLHALPGAVVVDHGHASSAGESHVSFIFRRPPGQTAQHRHDDDGGDGRDDHGHGPDDDEHGGGGRRGRRGRDLWHDGQGDPWSGGDGRGVQGCGHPDARAGGGAVLRPRKAPRRHADQVAVLPGGADPAELVADLAVPGRPPADAARERAGVPHRGFPHLLEDVDVRGADARAGAVADPGRGAADARGDGPCADVPADLRGNDDVRQGADLRGGFAADRFQDGTRGAHALRGAADVPASAAVGGAGATDSRGADDVRGDGSRAAVPADLRGDADVREGSDHRGGLAADHPQYCVRGAAAVREAADAPVRAAVGHAGAADSRGDGVFRGDGVCAGIPADLRGDGGAREGGGLAADPFLFGVRGAAAVRGAADVRDGDAHGFVASTYVRAGADRSDHHVKAVLFASHDDDHPAEMFADAGCGDPPGNVARAFRLDGDGGAGGGRVDFPDREVLASRLPDPIGGMDDESRAEWFLGELQSCRLRRPGVLARVDFLWKYMGCSADTAEAKRKRSELLKIRNAALTRART